MTRGAFCDANGRRCRVVLPQETLLCVPQGCQDRRVDQLTQNSPSKEGFQELTVAWYHPQHEKIVCCASLGETRTMALGAMIGESKIQFKLLVLWNDGEIVKYLPRPDYEYLDLTIKMQQVTVSYFFN